MLVDCFSVEILKTFLNLTDVSALKTMAHAFISVEVVNSLPTVCLFRAAEAARKKANSVSREKAEKRLFWRRPSSSCASARR